MRGDDDFMGDSKIKLKLDTPQNIRKSLAKVGNMAINGEIDPKYVNCLIPLCNTILSSIRTDEQEKKIEELTKILEQLENKN